MLCTNSELLSLTGNIIAGNLYYELTTFTHNITNDQFTFEVKGSKSNVVPGNIFHIQWAWFIMAQKAYNITETSSVVRIYIQRTGNLKNRASVTCLPRGTSAKGKPKTSRDKDFVATPLPVVFNEGDVQSFCEIPIHDDNVFEVPEIFSVKLVSPNYALLGKSKKSFITINDNEDMPSLFFESSQFAVDETEEVIYVRVKRSGDINIPVSVMCSSVDGVAKGSLPNDISSGADFIHRPSDESSRVVFPPGVRVSSCVVKIIDDLIFENGEDFRLILTDPSEDSMLGDVHEASITIRGPNDQSVIGFIQTAYNISESENIVSVYMERTGLGLNYPSSVWCATQPHIPEEAQPSLDYVPYSEQINFRVGQERADCTINIIDDKVNPKLEGPERFRVFISTAQNGTIDSSTSQTVITILDLEDAPSIQFIVPEVTVLENQTVVKIPLQRSGDLSKVSTVYCFTRQRSAKAGIDFMERPNSEASLITFPKGVSKVECEIGLLDHIIYEKEETFIVKLSHPDSPSSVHPYIGENKVVRVTIIDWEDRPRLSFQHSTYTITEPPASDMTTSLAIPVIRLGDATPALRVMVSTRDGSATSGADYHAMHKEVKFAPGETM